MNNNQLNTSRGISFLRNRATVLAIPLLLAACVAPLPKNASVVHEGQTVAIVTLAPTKPGFYRVGQQGLLDIAVNHAMTATVATHVESLEVPSLDRARDQAADILRTRGYKVVVEPNPIDLSKLSKFDGNQAHRTAGDWREWGAAHHADYVLLISLFRYGAARPYYGFIPTGKPYPVGDLVVEVIDPKTNTEMSADRTSVSAQPVGEWDTPPSYTALSTEIAQHFESSLQAFPALVQSDFPGFGPSDGFATTAKKVTASASTAE